MRTPLAVGQVSLAPHGGRHAAEGLTPDGQRRTPRVPAKAVVGPLMGLAGYVPWGAPRQRRKHASTACWSGSPRSSCATGGCGVRCVGRAGLDGAELFLGCLRPARPLRSGAAARWSAGASAHGHPREQAQSPCREPSRRAWSSTRHGPAQSSCQRRTGPVHGPRRRRGAGAHRLRPWSRGRSGVCRRSAQAAGQAPKVLDPAVQDAVEVIVGMGGGRLQHRRGPPRCCCPHRRGRRTTGSVRARAHGASRACATAGPPSAGLPSSTSTEGDPVIPGHAPAPCQGLLAGDLVFMG